MTTEPEFDRHMQRLLRDALDRESGPHPVWADSPAARRIAERGRHGRFGRWPARTLAIAAILLLGAGTISALVAGGAVRLPEISFAIHPSPTDAIRIPGELHGVWGSGNYRLDFRSTSFLSRRVGAPLPELGGVVEVAREAGPTAGFVLRIDGPCGRGVYTVVREEVYRIRFTEPFDKCLDRVAILTNTSWVFASAIVGPTLGPFVAGQTYDSGNFTEPFQFVMPAVDGISATPLSGRHATTYVTAGGLRFGDVYWSMRILDDLPVNSDLCDDASALLPDIPSTPNAVGEWLRTHRGWRVSEGVPVPIDGRIALRFDIDERQAGPACHGGRLPPGGDFGYAHVAYAIPTGDDTILVIGGGDDLEGTRAVIDAFVRSMDFQ